ncbi:T9SS type A sorting domain-containing protein [Algibacter sp. AS12]|uniref:T9SS type A sorting domain-containing protein n=1 Tax=Algibacter sp. AS12 TaxID=3135773 RepID=UPI00398B4CC4
MINLNLKNLILIAVVALFSFQEVMAQVYPVSDPSNNGNWVLNTDISDEFDGGALDEVKWQIQGKDGIYKSNFIGRAPSQFNPNNVLVENDKLKIRTKWEPSFPFSSTPQNGVAYENITTAALISKQQFQYGYMEIMSKAAKAEITSSFWTTGFQSELDMFEMFGDPKDVNLAWRKRLKFNMISWDPNNTYYLPDGNGPAHTRNIQADNNTADAFHVYGFEWTSEYIKVYIDGVLHPNGTILKSVITNNGADNERWVTDVSYWIWFDSETFPWLGIPDQNDLATPVDYEIEYIRVWQTNPAIDEVSVTGTTDAAEPDSNGEFTVSLPSGVLAGEDILVNYTVGGTATEGTDYSNLSGTVTILNGNNSALIPINVIDDSDTEGSETIIITLSSTSVGTINTTPAEINIIDTALSGTTLSAGDVAIVGWKAEGSNNGAVAFMLLKDIVANTKISFSNRSWKGSQDGWTGDYSVDDVWTWTAGTSYSVGTIFKLDSDGLVKRATGGTESIVGSMTHDVLGKIDSSDDDSSFDLSSGGDSVLVYQVYGAFSEPIDPMSSAWITGINTNGGWGTGGGNTFCALPTILANGLTANAVGSDQDNGFYTSELLGNVSSLRASINNSANWITDEDVIYNLWSYAESVGANFGNIGSAGTLSISNFDRAKGVSIYPNPISASTLQNINVSASGAKRIVLYDILGTQLLSVDKNTEPYKLPIENLKSGVYFISIIFNTKSETNKIVIK